MKVRNAIAGFGLAMVATVGGMATAQPAAAATAPGAFGPAAVVLNCIPGGADASIAADGAVRGFATCNGGVGEGPISYFGYRSGTAVYRQSTPWKGQVLAAAWDGVGATYVVFSDNGILQIGKRLENATFSPTTVLAVDVDDHTTADLVASHGKWWTVWSRHSGSDPTGPLSLFQAHTLLGTQLGGKITNPPAQGADSQPALTWNGSVLYLIWTRTANAAGAASDIWWASSTGGAWASAPFATVGTRNSAPSAVDAAGSVRVTWVRDGRIMYASRGTTYLTHSFASTGSNPKVGYSGGQTFLAWQHNNSLLFVQSSGSGWTSAVLAGFPGVPRNVMGQGGKARVLYLEDERLTINKQR